MNRHSRLTLLIAGLVLATAWATASAQQSTDPLARPTDGVIRPTAEIHATAPLKEVPIMVAEPLDVDALRQEDTEREQLGMAPRFAVPQVVDYQPDSDGLWEWLDAKTLLWRLRLSAPGALSLNLGFTRYFMPAEGRLFVYSADSSEVIGPFTADDNEDHGELWTPILLTDDIIVEVTIPAADMSNLELTIGSFNVGYRGFGELVSDRSGSCNNDVICSVGDDWRDEIPSVAVISTGGSAFCSGFLVNNTAQDETPYFMTAYHCGINSSNDASLVTYWNFESPTCGQQGGGSMSQYNTGSTLRATYSTSDFTLVELDDALNPNYNLTFAGWDRTSSNPTSAVGIHHPSCDEKSISFEDDACTTTDYLGTSTPGDGTHIRVIDWDDGTTEGGSSGSPLFNQNHHVVGQLHGGYAACGNDSSDWYGRFSVSWTGGGSSSSRLSDWLDPISSGATTLDTLVPGASGISVTPSAGLDSAGDPGGPFTPASKQYVITNDGSSGINYAVTKSQSWITVSPASGYLTGGNDVTVTVSINSNANSLSIGDYSDTVYFTNTTDHTGDTQREVTLQVGGPSLVYDFPMDSDPGWSTEGLWEFGQPTGDGGDHGNPDPSSGYTGNYVYGYNLNGDYENDLDEQNLTTTALDFSNVSDVTLSFWRYLGVEQPSYDHAYLKISSNGSTWTTLWENTAVVEDSSWTYEEYDISAYADGESTVYIRWVMGETDGSWQYCGWNIDDIEIWGINACTSPSITEQPQSATRYYGESVTFEVAATGTETLEYQWIHNSSDISGATSDSYTISAVDQDDAGYYYCTVSNGCGSVTSSAATLTVEWERADSNCDGEVNFNDIDYFVAALISQSEWEAMFAEGPYCGYLEVNDINNSGVVNFDDIDYFVDCLVAGGCE